MTGGVSLTRLADIGVLLLLAIAILMPRPGVKVKPAFRAGPDERHRAAELQARMVAAPGDVEASMELADLFLDARRPDWALASLGPALAARPGDHRLYGRRALALADHFEAGPAYDAAKRALALCEGGSSAKCGGGEKSRLTLLVTTLEKIRYIDMRKDPNTAKENILHGLHPVYVPKAKIPAAAVAAPPTQGNRIKIQEFLRR